MLTLIQKRQGHLSSIVFHERSLERLFHADFFEAKPEYLDQRLFQISQLNNPKPVPTGYGLVMVDFDEQWIGSLQRYLSLERISSVMTLRSMPESFQELWKQGFFTQGVFLDEKGQQTIQSLDETGKTFSDLLDISQWKASRRRPVEEGQSLLTALLFQPPNWTIETYPESVIGFASLAAQLQRRGVDVVGHLEGWRQHLEATFAHPERFSDEFSRRLHDVFGQTLPSTPAKPASMKFL